MDICECYEKITNAINENIYYGICNGTRERERCSCNGDRKACDFYPEKREDTTQAITNRQWLNSLSNEDFCKWLLNKYTTQVKFNGYTIITNLGLSSLMTSSYDSYNGVLKWLDELHE